MSEIAQPSRAALIRAVLTEMNRVRRDTPARADAYAWLHATTGINADDDALCTAILGYHTGQLAQAELDDWRLLAFLADDAGVCAFLEELLRCYRRAVTPYPARAACAA